ncbi:enoyl-CoA hydratase/isomerase family protein [Arenibacterium halophilum]|uniref:Enoyl-CoA hydratase/isomerase family protein n=1 Tax=Arenibacterium halophilum TaxID=2583821 RepID=A0ABY2XD70_9RHOB|nr:enoyl-CoA hydratase/isomerase family protein [Arenibacterium halophilum]TMV13672.1 enoyl-CoA hydratase/isomerase family protein [Arenibacterium halophilum]
MAQGSATLTVNEAVARITFSNPDQGFMDEAMEAELAGAVAEVCSAPGIRVCVLTGGLPDVFIRHYDLKVLAPKAAAMAERGLSFTTDRPVPEGMIHKAMRQMEASPVIFIAALNGTAMGGGFELALACDLRLVQNGDYQFGLPEINLGILPGAGGTQRLPHLVGQARALQMTLTGQTLSPQKMVDWGLAIDCVADVQDAAHDLADQISRKPARAAAHIKQLVRRAKSPSAEGLANERTLFCDLMVQEDGQRLLAEGASGQRRITDAP